MALNILQGVQDASKDNQFEPIVGTNIVARVTGIKLSEKFDNALNMEFTIISAGPHHNKKFFDTVNYAPDSQFSWRYRAMRKACGVPYTPGEPGTLDIEAITMNKAVVVDLSKNEKGYQAVKYTTKTAAEVMGGQAAPAQSFNGYAQQQPQQQFAQQQPQQQFAQQPQQTPAQQWGAPQQGGWDTQDQPLDIASDDLPF